jgi:hypothetical protein
VSMGRAVATAVRKVAGPKARRAIRSKSREIGSRVVRYIVAS